MPNVCLLLIIITITLSSIALISLDKNLFNVLYEIARVQEHANLKNRLRNDNRHINRTVTIKTELTNRKTIVN